MIMNQYDFIEFARTIGKLKKIPRTGWKVNGVKDCESVADHVFRVASLAMVLSDELKMDTGKIVKMALLHDWEEVITGDIRSPEKEQMGDAVSKKGVEAFQKIIENLPENIKTEYLKLWKEFEDQKTDEAKFVKNVDLIEMLIQCLEYEKEQSDATLQEFWVHVDKRLKDPYFRKIFDITNGMRK